MNPRIKPYKDFIHLISEIEGILFIVEDIIIVSEELSATVTDSMHKLGHQGQVNTLALIKQHFFNLDMAAQVISLALMCDLYVSKPS